MSVLNKAAQELENWVKTQLRKGIRKDQLYFFLVEKGFGFSVSSAMLDGYKPVAQTAMIENYQGRHTLPQPNWFEQISYFFSLANLPFVKENQKYKHQSNLAQLFTIPDVIPEKLCQQLIIRSKRHFSPSKTVADDNHAQSTGRSSSTALVRDVAADADRKIQAAIAGLLKIDPKYCEPLQIQRYEPGQEYKLHADWFDSARKDYKSLVSEQGQRTWSCLIYLNQDFTGGKTLFPKLQKAVTAKSGQACIWNNLTLTGKPNKATYHSGMPVTAGTKYVLTAWFRARPKEPV